MSFLTAQNMVGGYGGSDILKGCTIAVERGEIVVIVGPNGAGKSTAMKAIFGMLDLREGQVRLGEDDITGLSPQERVRRGMGFVPQNNNVFSTMTVMENLEMGAYLRDDTVLIRLRVGEGPGEGRAWGCDLSDQYVRINADYTT